MEERTAPIFGYLNCYVTSEGKVYNGGKLKLSVAKKGKAPKIRLQENGHTREYGLATLLAQSFIPNPNSYTKVVFKDGNNQNCRADNLRWVSNEEAVRHSLFKGKPLLTEKEVAVKKEKSRPLAKNFDAFSPVKKKIEQVIKPIDASAVLLPGFPNYYITPCSKIYSKERLLRPQQQAGKAARIKVKSSSGILERHTIAWLLATTFIPNPLNHPKVVFRDRNKSNLSLDNLMWVSLEEYHRYYHTTPDLLGTSKPKKVVESVWIDPERVPLEGFPNYFISPTGIVYRGNKLVKPVAKEGKAFRVRLRRYENGTIQKYFLGLAKLVAQHFIPNPKGHEYTIFKDRNNQNCCKDNIAWVDGETFIYYSMVQQNGGRWGRKKIIGEREEAAKTCTYELLRNYYLTEDNYWLEKCWNDIDNRLQNAPNWLHLQAECYLYFLDRAQRYSILKDPVGLLLSHLKGLKVKLRNEISLDIPFRKLMQTDESLRNVDQYANLEE